MSAAHDDGADREDAGGWSRRDFVAMSVAAGLASIAPGVTAAETLEKELSVSTPDGASDAVYFCPAGGATVPGVLLWTDAFGLRPAMRAIGRRLASAGYAVLVPNPYYRNARAPVLDTASFNFRDPADRARLKTYMDPLMAAGAAERDATAYAAFLDAQPQVDRGRKLGAFGYCMGGGLMFRSLATLPARFGAGASFHGGGLVTDTSDSPHLLIPKMDARLYIAIAANDDAAQPEAKDVLRAAFDAAGLNAEIEVYPGTLHGWCVPDMPAPEGPPIYNQPDAERAWAKLLALYGASLA